jgi:hypothetical protein
MDRPSRIIPRLLGPVVLLVLTACGGESAGERQARLTDLFTGEDRLALYADLAAVRGSPFAEAVGDLSWEQWTTANGGDWRVRWRALTGTEPEDWQAVALVASEIGEWEEGLDPGGALLGFSVRGAHGAEQVEQWARSLAATEGEEVEVSRGESRAGEPLVTVRSADGEEVQVLLRAGPGDSTLLFAGDPARMEDFLARPVGEGQLPESLAAVRDGLVDAEAQVWMRVEGMDAVRADLRGATREAAALFPGLRPAGEMEGMAWALRVGEGVDFALQVDLPTEEQAAALQSTFQNQLIALARLFLSQGSGPPLPLLETLASEREGRQTLLRVRIEPADVRGLHQRLAADPAS